MFDIASAVNELGGMAQKQQIVRRGASDYDFTLAVRRGEVTRVRNGWYSTMAESDPRLRAVRVGGRLTGISAIAELRGWVLARHPLHVSVPMNAARLRAPGNRERRLLANDKRGVQLHWDSADVGQFGTATSVGLRDALLRVALDEDWETTIAAFDWALRGGLIEMTDVEVITAKLPERLADLASWVDSECESLPESLSRTRLRLEGHHVTSQVPVGVNQRIDLVVDRHVGFEVDGEEFHLTKFAEDRDKDLLITMQGLHAMRPTARHVFYEWPRVHGAICVALESRGVVPSENSGLGPASHLRGRRRARNLRGRRRRTPEFSEMLGPRRE